MRGKHLRCSCLALSGRHNPGTVGTMTASRTSRQPGHWYDVHRDAFPFGLREWLGRVQAVTRPQAEELAAAAYGPNVLVSLAYGTRKQAAKPLEERLAHKRSGRAPRHRRRSP